MLRDIVVDLADEAGDVVIAGEVPSADAVDALGDTRADFVIGGRVDEQLVRELLGQRPSIAVLTVSDDGHEGTLHRLAVLTTPLGDLSPHRLLAIARATTEPPTR